MRVTIRNVHLTIAALLSMAATVGSHAADGNSRSSAAAAADSQAVQELDEILVRGTRVRDAIAAAEDEFFLLYNSLNKDDDYSASCVFIPLGDTQIRSHICIPGFMADALADQVYFAEQCRASAVDGVAAPCYTPPTPQQVLTERSRSYANNLMKVIRSDERLGRMAGNLDNLYLELASIQQQYLKVRAGSAATPPGPRAQ
jgi:hypothetical protein